MDPCCWYLLVLHLISFYIQCRHFFPQAIQASFKKNVVIFPQVQKKKVSIWVRLTSKKKITYPLTLKVQIDCVSSGNLRLSCTPLFISRFACFYYLFAKQIFSKIAHCDMPEQVDLISSNYTFNVIPLLCQNTLMTESVTSA